VGVGLGDVVAAAAVVRDVTPGAGTAHPLTSTSSAAAPTNAPTVFFIVSPSRAPTGACLYCINVRCPQHGSMQAIIGGGVRA
jgi:hypothetical protein